MHLWLDAGFGASGDMLLGALVGLGAPLGAIQADLDRLDVDGWRLDHTETHRAGIAATRVEVTLTGAAHHDPTHPSSHDGATAGHDPAHRQPDGAPARGQARADGTPGHAQHRTWSSIDALLAASELPAAVADGARATFRLLGDTEAAMHGVDIDEVHFHEVGAVDAVIDIVGTWSALHHLGVEEVSAGPVGLGGGGTVSTAHGELPVPAPATAALLTGLPVRGLDTPQETITPTGAALVRSMVTRWGPIPDGTLVAASRGAGGRNPDTHPNVVSALLVHPADAGRSTGSAPSAPAIVLATNLDDVTAEVLGHTLDRLIGAGADDAWLVPIGMKKSRPGHELRVLCRPELADELGEIVFAETGTLGLRAETVVKRPLDRRFETVEIHGCQVRIKVGPHGAKPEHDDLVTVSRSTGLPLRQLTIEALRAHDAADF